MAGKSHDFKVASGLVARLSHMAPDVTLNNCPHPVRQTMAGVHIVFGSFCLVPASKLQSRVNVLRAEHRQQFSFLGLRGVADNHAGNGGRLGGKSHTDCCGLHWCQTHSPGTVWSTVNHFSFPLRCAIWVLAPHLRHTQSRGWVSQFDTL